MRHISRLRLRGLAAVAAMLAAVGCDNAANDSAAADNIVVGNAAEEPVDDGGGMDETRPEPEESGGAVEIPALPAGSSDLEAAQLAALDEAGAIADRIDGGDGVERVEVRGGAAWLAGGEVIRVADASERGRVAYFRAGEENPFLIQRGDNAWFITGGEASAMLNRRGRPVEIDERRREQASRLVRRAAATRRRAAREEQRGDAAG